MANWTPQTKIIIESYNPEWITQFNTIKAELEVALNNTTYISIEHVGSTSIPNLDAKPVIDIDIIVGSRADVQPIVRAITSKLSYEYIGEMGIIDRHAFRLRGAVPSRNLYVCVEGSKSLRNHLGVRDVLKGDAELRDEYGRVKRELAARARDIDEYIEGKGGILQRILKKAGVLTQEELDEIARANDAEAFREERRKVNLVVVGKGGGEAEEKAVTSS
jgi:GrpB-like predicted nucleotidyltransferase (UPF0157 family)